MPRVMALTVDGRLTFCTAPPELRGIGRCNHVAHQKDGQSKADFLREVENLVAEEGNIDETDRYGGPAYEMMYSKQVEEAAKMMPKHNKELALELAGKYGIIKDGDWVGMLKDMKNPFVIGKESDGSYEEAKLVDVDKTMTEDGRNWKIVAHYEFRGKVYDCDYGEIPAVLDGGVININGALWRPLPVLSQRKAGVISYANNVVLTQEDGNVAVIIRKLNDESGQEIPDSVEIRGRTVPVEDVRAYLHDGDASRLTVGQKYALDVMDPAVKDRLGDWTSDENLRKLAHAPMDAENDLEWRRLIRYEDMVAEQYRLQMRRMGVTFRTNLKRRQDAAEQGMSEEEMDELYPLFYQKNLTDNIKSSLVKRSNVQTAEQLNPISALTQSQKISFTGPGGFNKDAAPYELRMPHATHEGVIDPLVVSSGKNIGLTACMTGGEVGADRYVHKKSGETMSPSDFIPYKYHNDPSRGTMACAHLTQACPIVGGEDPIVSTPAWDSIKGAKLGVNLKVAYVADKDCFEDAVKISESAAKRMGTVQTQQYRCFDQRAMNRLKVGQYVHRKQEIGGVEVKVEGVVKSVGTDGFEVETYYPMMAGDKLSNRHGAKSVVARVVPDNEMPQVFNESTGKLEPADIVMTPMGVVGRKNLGQIMECNEAAQRTGMHVATGDNKLDGPSLERRSVVVSGGKRVEATAGVEYVMRLNHIAAKKLQSHADEITKSGEFEGVRLGEMEAILLSTDKDRLKILNYLRHQEQNSSHERLDHLLRAVGVDMKVE